MSIFSKIEVRLDELLLLNGLRYRPGIGLEWKEIQKSSKLVEQKKFKLIFCVSSTQLQKGAAFFFIRVVSLTTYCPWATC